MDAVAWTYPVAVVALGYLVLGMTGFGSALVIVPLLAWRWPLAEVVPLVLLTDVVASAVMGRLNLRLVRWDVFRQLMPGIVLGCALGWLLGRWSLSAWPLLLLGAYVVWVGVRAWRAGTQPPPPPAGSLWLGSLYGLGVGLVQMMFGTAGPLVLAWLARRQVPPQAVRASTPVIMLVVAAFVLALFAVEGRLAQPVVWDRLWVLLPVGVLAVFTGHSLAHRLPAEGLRRAICGLLVLSGALLTVNALRQLA